MEDFIKDITKTVDGYLVKDLRYLTLDNIIVGLVKDPIYGNPHLRDGYISAQWNRYGKPIKLNKGRKELILNLFLYVD